MPTQVCYSVGVSTANLMTGTPTVTVSGTTATFSAPQTGNIGIGDQVTYGGSNVAFIAGKTSTTVWTVRSATGGTPAAATDATVNSILRAFNTLGAAIGLDSIDGTNSGAANSAHLNQTHTSATPLNLVALDVDLWICLYADGEDSGATVEIRYITTDATRRVVVYAPRDTATEANQSQRYTGTEHSGYWRSTGIIRQIANCILDGIEIDGLGTLTPTNGALWTNSSASFSPNTTRNMVIHSTAGADGFAIGQGELVQDCIAYDITNGDGFQSYQTASNTNEFRNCLSYSCAAAGFREASPGSPTYVNCLSLNNAGGGWVGGTGSSDYNVSSDATAPGAHVLTGRTSYSSYFADSSVATFDPHLLGTTGDGGIFGATGLLGPSNSSDANVQDADIFGTTRPSGATAVCIGPAEYVSSGTIHEGQATLTGTSGQSAAGELIIAAAATLAGTGGQSAAAELVLQAAATLAGTGGQSATPELILEAIASLPGVGGLFADGSIAGTQEGQATLAGTSGQVAAAELLISAAATLAGTSGQVATPELILEAIASLPGVGGLIADGSTAATQEGQATLAGTSGQVATAELVLGGAAVLAGSGGLAADADLDLAGVVVLAATGGLAADANLDLAAVAVLAGAGGVVAVGSLDTLFVAENAERFRVRPCGRVLQVPPGGRVLEIRDP